MQTVNLKQSLASGVSMVLDNLSPKAISTLKQMKLVQNSAEKFAKASFVFFNAQHEINNKVKEMNVILKSKATLEEKKTVEEEANKLVMPMIEERDRIGEEICETELSNDEVEFLRVNFKSLISDNFKTIRHALEVAEALGVDFEAEEEEKKK